MDLHGRHNLQIKNRCRQFYWTLCISIKSHSVPDIRVAGGDGGVAVWSALPPHVLRGHHPLLDLPHVLVLLRLLEQPLDDRAVKTELLPLLQQRVVILQCPVASQD